MISKRRLLSAEIEVVTSGKPTAVWDRSMVGRVMATTTGVHIPHWRQPEVESRQYTTNCCLWWIRKRSEAWARQELNGLRKYHTNCWLVRATSPRWKFAGHSAIPRCFPAMWAREWSAVCKWVKRKRRLSGAENVFNKYTARGQGQERPNDANPEYIAQLRGISRWSKHQLSGLPNWEKVIRGGGGTIAYIMGNYNMDVIDAGVAVMNMHAPLEVAPKQSVYEAYQT